MVIYRGSEDTLAFAGTQVTPEAQSLNLISKHSRSWYQFLQLGPHLTSVLPLLPAFSPAAHIGFPLFSLPPTPSLSSSF